MVILSHPTGNQNVRQALAALHESGLLDKFCTTVYWDENWPLNRWIPDSIRSELNRRCYPQVPRSRVRLTPLREAMRLLTGKLGIRFGQGEDTPFSATRVYRSLDVATAIAIEKQPSRVIYAYEGVALHSFRAARRRGMLCVYELPTAYWYYDADLFKEEAELQPEYASTIATLHRSTAQFEARDEELSLADTVIIPSHYIKRTLERSSVPADKLFVIPYGASEDANPPVRAGSRAGKLRVIYVGALTQRKGISYLIDAVKMLGSSVELTVIGRKVGLCRAVDAAVKENIWIESAPHSDVLEQMSRNDVLVLPSLSEGFGLVILEAMSCGLPVITTRNSGGPEIIRDGRDGFFVPIRSAEAIAEKLETLARDRNLLESMSESARQRARECTWRKYRDLLVSTMARIMQLQIGSSRG